ncbi:preprotein translocase subunit Sec61beta [Candidatus Woesearchaeota archaeon]|nr:preprotein translocase subunit Sec61beta [Candidatus Woesearchaeota archaeon]
MARRSGVQMPSSGGGLIRYFDEYRSKIEIKPGLVVIACIVVIVLVLVLKAYGERWLV